MNFDWFLNPVKNQYADFDGRTNREAFWMFVLFHFMISIAVSIVSGILHLEILYFVFALGMFVPAIAITTRRLHDVNKTGWLQLLFLIPLIGLIIMIVILAGKGDEGANKYGEVTGTPVPPTPMPTPAPTETTSVPPTE